VTRVVTQSERSAGGVLWRPCDREVAGTTEFEVCLISTRGGSRWQLPKGHVSEGETEAEAARREVREETGCDGEIEADLGEIVFWFFVGGPGERRRVKKSVHFFLLRYHQGVTSDHDGEVDDAAWLPAKVAITKLTFDSERAILVKAVEQLTAPVPAPVS
jgi:8-oxo-dGTP pyrophosphatase MutT (NUDIX family)